MHYIFPVCTRFIPRSFGTDMCLVRLVGSKLAKSSPITGLDSPLVFQEFETSRNSRYSAHEGSKVVNKTHRLPLLQNYIPGTYFY
jgi:hypothetical protein